MTRIRLPFLVALLAMPLLSAAAAEESIVANRASVDLAARAAGYATADELKALDEPDRVDFVTIVHDQTWAPRHIDYLRKAQKMEVESFQAAPKEKQGAVVLEWLHERSLARENVKVWAKAGVMEPEKLKGYAESGFLSPLLTREVLGDGSPTLANLKGLSLGLSGEALAKLDKAFDNNAATPDDSKVIADLHQLGMTQTVAPADELSRSYDMSRQMILDPAGFRVARPDLAKDTPPDQAAAQNNLSAKIGHIYRTADFLRSQGRLEIEWAKESDMNGAMADTALMVEPDDKGQAQWKIRVRVNESYKGGDPALLSPTLTHELEHAYDYYVDVQKYGQTTAQFIHDYQEEEERAFIAESYLHMAYASAFDRSAAALPYNAQVQSLSADSRTLRALGQIADDQKAYRATLAALAESALRRGYVGSDGGLHDLDSMIAFYQKTQSRNEVALLKAQKGTSGLDAEIARIRGDATARRNEAERLGYLIEQREGPSLSEADAQRRVEQTAGVLKALREEKTRDLGLQADGGLKTAAVPLP